ncbi:hypothetical protein Tco_0568008 [Tanacetum coccineum]
MEGRETTEYQRLFVTLRCDSTVPDDSREGHLMDKAIMTRGVTSLVLYDTSVVAWRLTLQARVVILSVDLPGELVPQAKSIGPFALCAGNSRI